MKKSLITKTLILLALAATIYNNKVSAQSNGLWSANGPTITYTGRNAGNVTETSQAKLEVGFDDALIKGTDNFFTNNHEAILYLGDNSHYIKSIYGNGLRIGTYEAVDAIAIQQTTGNVGIGTTTPGYKLDVCGSIRASEVRVNLQGCDFVLMKIIHCFHLKNENYL